jgi:hypothetical protein
MSTLATGVFLTGYAVALGVSNLAIGILAAAPSAVQFLQFPAAVLVERLRRRRAISVWAATIGRSFLLAAAVAPALGSARRRDSADCRGCNLAGLGGRCWLSLEFVDARPRARAGLRPLLRPACGGQHGSCHGARPALWRTHRSMEIVHTELFYHRLSGSLSHQRRVRVPRRRLLSITPDWPMQPPATRSPVISMLVPPFGDRNVRRLIALLACWSFAANLAASCAVGASCAALAPIVGGLCAAFFAAHELSLGFTWKTDVNAVTVDVLNLHAWTFFFGLAFLLGLLSLHRLFFVQEANRAINPPLMRDLLLEARNAVRGLSSVAGLVRIGGVPLLLLRRSDGKIG